MAESLQFSRVSLVMVKFQNKDEIMLKLKTMALALTMLVSVVSWAEQDQPVEMKAQPQVTVEKTEASTAIDINSADAKQLSKLSNIGLKKAQQIIEYRTLHGQFSSIDDLQKVKGIGRATIDKNRLRMVVAAQ